MAFTQTKKFDSGVLRLTDNTNIFIGEPIWIVNNYALKLNITKSTYTEDLDTKELNENCYGVFKSFKNAVYWLRENKGILDMQIKMLETAMRATLALQKAEQFPLVIDTTKEPEMYLKIIDNYLETTKNSEAFYKNLILVVLKDLKQKHTS